MRNVYALTLGDLPDRLAFKRLDLFAVEEEFQRLGLAVARSHLVAFRRHQLPSGFDNSSGKYFITHNRGSGRGRYSRGHRFRHRHCFEALRRRRGYVGKYRLRERQPHRWGRQRLSPRRRRHYRPRHSACRCRRRSRQRNSRQYKAPSQNFCKILIRVVQFPCPLSWSLLGVKRTWPFAAHMSAFDPKRTFWSTMLTCQTAKILLTPRSINGQPRYLATSSD